MREVCGDVAGVSEDEGVSADEGVREDEGVSKDEEGVRMWEV